MIKSILNTVKVLNKNQQKTIVGGVGCKQVWCLVNGRPKKVCPDFCD